MVNFKKDGGTFDVFGWDAFNGDDDVFFGVISTFDGYWWFHPMDGMSLSCGVMRQIASKISELNLEYKGDL